MIVVLLWLLALVLMVVVCWFIVLFLLFGQQRPKTYKKKQNPLFYSVFFRCCDYRSLATERPTAQGHQKITFSYFFVFPKALLSAERSVWFLCC